MVRSCRVGCAGEVRSRRDGAMSVVGSAIAVMLGMTTIAWAAEGESPDRLSTESVVGEGVWIDPGLTAIRSRSGRAMVTVWFDRQFLGDGEAYGRRAKEFAKWKRGDLRKAVAATLKEISRDSHRRAAAKLKELQSSGKLTDLQKHWIVNGFTAAISLDALDDLSKIPGVKKIFLARRRRPVRSRPMPSKGKAFTESEREKFRADRYKHPWYARYLLADKVWREFGVAGQGTLNVVHDFNFIWFDQVTGNLYRNPKEIPSNGKDDDGNGYIDDVHGYNFDADSPRLMLRAAGGGRQAIGQLHGVLCASIICGTGSEKVPYELGLAPEARWAPVIGGQRLEAAVEWAVEQGADTYSMSFSIPGLEEYRSHWRKVMEHGSFCGIYFVSGAGNFAQQVPVPVQMRTPEDIPEVVFAAAGVQRDLSRTPFSSKGPVAWSTEHYRDGRVRKPEVCAFNAGLPVVLPDGRVIEAGANGNSFAGPMFCGAIALMLSADPELLPWDLKEIITSTATDVGPDGRDDETGYGLINVYRSVKEVLRRKAVREGQDDRPFRGREPGDELDVERIGRLAERVELAVAQVRPGSQAAKLGIRRGDVLVRAGGKKLTSTAALRKAREQAAGPLELVIRRAGNERTVKIKPGPLGIVILGRFPEPVFE